MKNYVLFAFLLLSGANFAQEKINVILIGTYHFNNPGFDQGKVKERNILEKSNQESLEKITDKIVKRYKPSKVFVEYYFSDKANLNRMFSLYKQEKPYYNLDTISKAKDFYKRFYAENEIFQFGFRLSKKAGNDLIYAMDYDKVSLRFDKIKAKIEESNLLKFEEYQTKIKEMEESINSCVSSSTLEEVWKCLNQPNVYQTNKGLYIEFLNRISQEPDFFGSELVSNWYKRNLIMFSNIQNQVTGSDKNIVVIAGVGHAAMFEEFFKLDKRFNLIKIESVL